MMLVRHLVELLIIVLSKTHLNKVTGDAVCNKNIVKLWMDSIDILLKARPGSVTAARIGGYSNHHKGHFGRLDLTANISVQG